MKKQSAQISGHTVKKIDSTVLALGKASGSGIYGSFKCNRTWIITKKERFVMPAILMS